MIAYQGSKRKEIPHILNALPEGHVGTFVDVFGGGGNVSFDLRIQARAYNIHYNDGDRMITMLAQAYKSTQPFPFLNLDPTDQNYKTVRERFNHQTGTLEDYLWLKRFAFRGLIGSEIMNKTKAGVVMKRNAPFMKNPRINVMGEITNLDYKKILERYKDDEDALLYMDPPYCNDFNANTDNTEYGGVELDPGCLKSLMEYAGKAKCSTMIHVPFDGFVYTRVQESKGKLNISALYPLAYNISKEKTPNKYHCIITNF